MEVKINDRDLKIEEKKIALNSCDIPVSYIQTELILKVLDKINEIGTDKYNIKHSAEILHDWRLKWEEYEQKNKDNDTKATS